MRPKILMFMFQYLVQDLPIGEEGFREEKLPIMPLVLEINSQQTRIGALGWPKTVLIVYKLSIYLMMNVQT